MKPTKFTTGRILLVLLISGITLGLVSWDQKQTPRHLQQTINDTVPKKKTVDREKKVRDLDDVLDELNEADMKVNMEKIQQEINDAMKKIDGDKIRMEIDRAMMEVDMAKIQKEVQESLAKVDFNKIKAEIAEAMKEIDMDKIQKEVKESLAKVDWDKMKMELEKVKDIDMKKLDAEMKKVKEEMKDIGPKIKKEMEKAKVEIEKAKTVIKEYKEYVDGLENDGLINKKEGYTLKHKDGELFINGKKASDQTYNKYRSFLEKHKKFNIKKDNNDFDLDMD
jgi:hypothetical protein